MDILTHALDHPPAFFWQCNDPPRWWTTQLLYDSRSAIWAWSCSTWLSVSPRLGEGAESPPIASHSWAFSQTPCRRRCRDSLQTCSGERWMWATTAGVHQHQGDGMHIQLKLPVFIVRTMPLTHLVYLSNVARSKSWRAQISCNWMTWFHNPKPP